MMEFSIFIGSAGTFYHSLCCNCEAAIVTFVCVIRIIITCAMIKEMGGIGSDYIKGTSKFTTNSKKTVGMQNQSNIRAKMAF